jgi:LmbE family N-acetylglucosaminyl deacetylase
MSKKKYNLLVVAHPDDESIFFAGLVLQKRTQPWRIICVTDGNADGNGAKRAADFAEACKLLKVKDFEFLNFKDKFEQRLPLTELINFLQKENPHEIFTHGPVGEYGHPHHQDVCFAVHQAFPKKKVFSFAYNCAPDFTVQLTKKSYQLKCRILAEVYHSETQRFMNLVPATYTEGYCRFSMSEIETIYKYYTRKELPDQRLLKKYSWLYGFFKIHQANPIGPRPF